MKWISSKQAAELGKSLAAIVLALVIGALFILVAGESPATAYSSLLKGALGTPQAVANTVSKSIPLAFTGLAVALGSRCGMLNIGAEGQLHAGAMAATLTGLTLSFLPAPILLVVSIAAGIAAGMLVGSVPGIFKAKFQTNEVIVAIMLNYVCTLFTSWLVNGPFKVPGSTCTDRNASGEHLVCKTASKDPTDLGAVLTVSNSRTYVHFPLENIRRIPVKSRRCQCICSENSGYSCKFLSDHGYDLKRRYRCLSRCYRDLRKISSFY